jgi:hypothetical protein
MPGPVPPGPDQFPELNDEPEIRDRREENDGPVLPDIPADIIKRIRIPGGDKREEGNDEPPEPTRH